MIPGLLCSKIPARCAKVHVVLKNAITERKKQKKKKLHLGALIIMNISSTGSFSETVTFYSNPGIRFKCVIVYPESI